MRTRRRDPRGRGAGRRGPVRAALLAIFACASGCGGGGGGTDAERYPFIVSADAAWKIGGEMVERVVKALETGNLDRFWKSLALKTRSAVPLDTLRQDYEKQRETLVMSVRTAKLMHVVPPNLESPYIDLRVVHDDLRNPGVRRAVEWWRLVYEEEEWRILQMGRTILDLEYNNKGDQRAPR